MGCLKLKEQQKVRAVKLSDLDKQLLEEKTRKQKLKAMNQELKSTVNKQYEEIKSIQFSNVQLQSSLQKAQIDVLDAGNTAFNKAKAQALCLYPDLDLSQMDFFKVVVNGHLVDIEQVEPFLTNHMIQEDGATVSNPEVEPSLKVVVNVHLVDMEEDDADFFDLVCCCCC